VPTQADEVPGSLISYVLAPLMRGPGVSASDAARDLVPALQRLPSRMTEP
jgi:hypothetical protein